MVSHASEAATDTGSASAGGRDQVEEDEVHELEDHEFTLDLDDTVEIQSSTPPTPSAVPPQPPLPRWAAASRALLDSWQKLLEVNAQATIEVPPPDGTDGPTSGKAAERATRERLSQLAVQLHAREVYCREIERALVTASGRVRGQAFRIAELEAELTELRARGVAQPADAQPAAKTQPKPSVASDDLQRIRGIGPRFAERLGALGVNSFETIAKWSAADVTTIAQQLGVKKERLTRDSWIKQARALKTPQRRRKAR